MANDIKSVVAFRAVDVRDIVRAPKCLVMAAEHDDPRYPVVENNTIMSIFFQLGHSVESFPSEV